MSEPEAQPNKQKIEEVEQKVDKLTQKVEQRDNIKKAEPAEKLKNEVSDLTTSPEESPRKLLGLVIVGAVLLFALIILALIRSALVWVAVILLLALILLTDKRV